MGWRGQRVSGEEEDGCCWRGVVLCLAPWARSIDGITIPRESSEDQSWLDLSSLTLEFPPDPSETSIQGLRCGVRRSSGSS